MKITRYLMLLFFTAAMFGADAANDLLLTQRNSTNDDNVSRNVTAAASALLAFDGSLVPTTVAIGTTAGTVAAGDDSRITGAAQKASNLSDLASATTARTNLGVGTGNSPSFAAATASTGSFTATATGTGLSGHGGGSVTFASGAVTVAPASGYTTYLTRGAIASGVIGGSIPTVFRNDSALEFQSATSPIISFFQMANPGTTSNECGIAFGAFDSAGAVQKTGSISSLWADATATTGYGRLRLNAVKNGGTDSVDFVLYGNHGAEFFGGDALTGPGTGILSVKGSGILLAGTSFGSITADSQGAISSTAVGGLNLTGRGTTGNNDISLNNKNGSTIAYIGYGSTTFTAAAGLQVNGTTSASSSTVGAFLVGNGTAATNVAIGGGNINAGGTATFGVATSAALTATTVGHLASQGTAPTAVVGAAAGTTPSAVTITGHDTAFTLALTTGTSCPSSGVLATLTFNTAFAAAPHVVFCGGGANGAAAMTKVYSTSTTTTFVLSVNAALTDATAYTFECIAVQ